MFILDTNVLSEVMAAQPAPPVAAWVSAQPPELLFTASICQAEIIAGIAILPSGRRRQLLEAAARTMFREDFAGRVPSIRRHRGRCLWRALCRPPAGWPPGINR